MKFKAPPVDDLILVSKSHYNALNAELNTLRNTRDNSKLELLAIQIILENLAKILDK